MKQSAPRPEADAAPTVQPVVDSPYASKPHEFGFAERFGDEIMVAGRLYRTGAPVVLWIDPGGYDAYRVDRRFAPFDESSWQATTQAMSRGDLEFVSTNQQFVPARYNLRYQRSATQKYDPDTLDQIRGGGWTLEELQKHVDQFVLHFDVCGTSEVCFDVLHDRRGLSVHFMLDIDGTIYQTLDLKERTWHATRSNDRSIGIEIANIGAYAVGQTDAPLRQWYTKDDTGQTVVRVPERLQKRIRQPGPYRPARSDRVVGEVQGQTLRMYDYTPAQYDSLIRLTAALADIFPNLPLEYPRDEQGQLITRMLTNDHWESFQGVLGHFHVQDDKVDPGPALQWDKLIDQSRKLLEERRAARQGLSSR